MRFLIALPVLILLKIEQVMVSRIARAKLRG